VPLKRSREFRGVRKRLAGEAPHPVVDSWLDEGFHFFVFQLDSEKSGARPQDIALAVFAMHPDQKRPVSAVTVVPTEDGLHARITDVRNPKSSYVAPLPGTSAS
jgi:hypothetical protein